MRLHYDCILCNINQVYKIIALHKPDDIIAKLTVKRVLEYLSDVDYSKTNPEIMGETWSIATTMLNAADLYSQMKKECNSSILNVLPRIQENIGNDITAKNKALKLAVTGNIIDYVGLKDQSIDAIVDTIFELAGKPIKIDDSVTLFEELHGAKTLLYIGDNCGEIILDKIFISVIRQEYTNLESIYYGVRGKPIVNDVTLEDANMINMEEIAYVVDNGDNSLGTVMSRVSSEFKKVFMDADVIISKGQGNFESLYNMTDKNIFHLFMVKCARISTLLDIPN